MLLTVSDCDSLTVDRDRSGEIDFDEFLIGIRGDMNDRRKNLVRMAFNILDSDGSGQVTLEEVMAVYDVSKSPDVISGKKTPKEAIQEFMWQWEGTDRDGIITYEEFEDYYKAISASIDGDDYFELMIRNAWRIAGGEGQAANTANKRVLVTNKDGTQSVQTLEKELGWKAGDLEGLKSRLGKQGIDTSQVELHGGIDTRPKGSTFQVSRVIIYVHTYIHTYIHTSPVYVAYLNVSLLIMYLVILYRIYTYTTNCLLSGLYC